MRTRGVWLNGYGSLVEAALAHGAGRRRELDIRKPGKVIVVDFGFRPPDHEPSWTKEEKHGA